jgi:hypothetical protein
MRLPKLLDRAGMLDLFDRVTGKLRRDMYVTVGLSDTWRLDYARTDSMVGSHVHLHLGPVQVLVTLLRAGAFVVQCRDASGPVNPFDPTRAFVCAGSSSLLN